MKDLLTQLQKPIGKSWLRLWHVLLLIALFWIAPLFMTSEFLSQNIAYIIIVLAVIYLVLTKYMPRAMRDTSVDVFLIERFCVFLTFLVPLIYSVLFGLKNGFITGLIIGAVFSAVGAAALAYSIALHSKSAQKYYHGVKKTDLFE